MGAKLENCLFSFKQFSNKRIQSSGPFGPFGNVLTKPELKRSVTLQRVKF